MWPYLVMFVVPAVMSMLAPTQPAAPERRLEFSWLLVGLVFAMLIGLRFQVGGDWSNYESHYRNALGVPLKELLTRRDPGYYFLIWLSAQVGGGIILVNIVFGALFSYGLVAFCRNQPRPWLALAVAVPYLIIVVAMGYSRQGAALGLTLTGLVAVAKHRNFQFVLCIALAATFHKSAVLLVPLAALSSPRTRLWTGLWVGIAAVALYWALLADSVDHLVYGYVEKARESDGAAIRIAMNAFPAALLLAFRSRFKWEPAERNLWSLMSLAALCAIPALLLSPSSTAVDRVALYLIPVQLFVFSRLPDVLGRHGQKRYWVVATVLLYGVVQLVWLTLGSHAAYWVPYRFYPLEGF